MYQGGHAFFLSFCSHISIIERITENNLQPVSIDVHSGSGNIALHKTVLSSCASVRFCRAGRVPRGYIACCIIILSPIISRSQCTCTVRVPFPISFCRHISLKIAFRAQIKPRRLRVIIFTAGADVAPDITARHVIIRTGTVYSVGGHESLSLIRIIIPTFRSRDISPHLAIFRLMNRIICLSGFCRRFIHAESRHRIPLRSHSPGSDISFQKIAVPSCPVSERFIGGRNCRDISSHVTIGAFHATGFHIARAVRLHISGKRTSPGGFRCFRIYTDRICIVNRFYISLILTVGAGRHRRHIHGRESGLPAFISHVQIDPTVTGIFKTGHLDTAIYRHILPASHCYTAGNRTIIDTSDIPGERTDVRRFILFPFQNIHINLYIGQSEVCHISFRTRRKTPIIEQTHIRI